jgi:hypothetical protein
VGDANIKTALKEEINAEDFAQEVLGFEEVEEDDDFGEGEEEEEEDDE